MPSIDIFQFIERFFAALTGFIYSAAGSFALLIRHPQRAPARLARRFLSDTAYQAGPLTLVFITLVAAFAGIEMSQSGRGAYADFDGADMARRLIPGWNGHLSPELGAVVLSAFIGTAIADAWARIMVTCGWPDFRHGFPARLRRRQRQRRVVASRYFTIVPLGITGLLFAAAFGVPAALGLHLTFWSALVVTQTLVVAMLVPNTLLLRRTLAAARPAMIPSFVLVFGWWFMNAAIFLGAAPLNTSAFLGYFRAPALAGVDAVAMPSLTCRVAPDGRISASLLLVNTGEQSVALAATPRLFLKWPYWFSRDMAVDGLAAETPYLVLKAGEARPINLTETEATQELATDNLNEHHCHVLWDLVGDTDGHYVDGRGTIVDERPAAPDSASRAGSH